MASFVEEIGTLLEDAGVSDETEVEASRDSLLNAESNYSQYVRRCTWYNRLDLALRMFSYYFEEGCYNAYTGEDNPTDDNSVEGMITDLTTILQDLAATYKASMTVQAQIKASTESDFVQVKCDGVEFLQAANANNRCPIEIKLFDLDQPSEGVPSVGPGRPLYVSTEVAKAAIDQVPYLPLDADPTLSKHADEEIVGVMLSAQIRNGGFWVKANLFPYNKPERVAQIRLEKDKLGASINALAPGHVEVVDGREVHVLDKLTLLGACILYANKATYSNTQVVAEKATVERQLIPVVLPETLPAPDQVAAIAQEQITPDLGDENVEELTKQIAALTDTVTTLVAAQTQSQATIDKLTNNVNQLTDDRNAALQAQASIDAENAAKTQREEMQAMVRQTALQSVREMMNPSGQPARLSSTVAASNEGTVIDPQSAQIYKLEGQLEELQSRRDPASLARRIALRDQLHSLKASAGIS
ncbi:MAG: hypothetical protein HC781_19165 [Leptolyngbyaceae cyanobacterium CSU_1_4]|nr:hypothetical protein [Leptolyngbyaceae cyanobacterium CSU_1_4]